MLYCIIVLKLCAEYVAEYLISVFSFQIDSFLELFPDSPSVADETTRKVRQDSVDPAEVLKPSVLQLDARTVMQRSDRARELFESLENGEEIDRAGFLDIANAIRQPIMKHCEV